MARGNRNTVDAPEFIDPENLTGDAPVGEFGTEVQTNTDDAPAESADNATTATESAENGGKGHDPDRGNIGTVAVRESSRAFTNARVRAVNNPVHIAVRDAELFKVYDIVVENDETKIDRVKRMLRAAAQNYKVTMNIHPEIVAEKDTDGNETGQKVISFRTVPRENTETTEETTNAETPGE